jgi:hypothetical protein
MNNPSKEVLALVAALKAGTASKKQQDNAAHMIEEAQSVMSLLWTLKPGRVFVTAGQVFIDPDGQRRLMVDGGIMEGDPKHIKKLIMGFADDGIPHITQGRKEELN